VSLFRGSLTYARFFVDPALSEPTTGNFADRFLEKLAAHPFEPLDPEGEAAERIGWCRVGEPFETSFIYEDLFFNEFMNIGFRIDRWVVPPSLLKAKTREAEAAYLVKKGRDRLTKKEKAELKDMVAKKLRKQLAPTTRIVDLSWSLNDGVVRFFTHSASVGAAMSELFRTTFGVTLIPEAPYTTAARLGLTAEEEAGWADLEPTILVTEETAPRERGAR